MFSKEAQNNTSPAKGADPVTAPSKGTHVTTSVGQNKYLEYIPVQPEADTRCWVVKKMHLNYS